ncbi:hypothetical protein ACFL2V_21240, partial [Pseudomonadota bacterium]
SAIEPKKITMWVIPWGLMLCLLVIAGISGGTYGWYRKKLNEIIAHCEKYQIRIDEDIMHIAEARKVSWKLLVKINKLKAPYIVRKGHTILVPKKNKNAKK